jgi:Tol biopolymer transport system component
MSGVPSRIGGYPIEREVGRGGMGVVYLGRDPRLDRPVAIKVLPEAFAADPERLARFEREARLLASLHHPNIAGIYGLEDDGPLRFLALEYVEGETLAERLARGALPLTEALEICRQVATALEAAHEAGIVHRDLKPGNIKLKPAGDVKVLDFGLAKSGAAEAASGSDLTQSPTMTHAATAAGIILGTAAYMSPEQARGRSVDKRSDIWSFGCVLYECLTGRQAFAGETVSDMIARILQGEPEWNALPARTPGRIRELLRRCLEKDARRRMRDIGDARIEIDEVLEKESSGSVAAAGAAKAKQRNQQFVVGAAAAIAAALVTTLGLSVLRPSTPPRLVRFEVVEPPGSTFGFEATDVAISPDGARLAFVARDSTRTLHLWVRPIDSVKPRMLPGTTSASLPFWSPDSRQLGFFANGKLRVVAVDGGDPDALCDAPTPRGGTWNESGTILFAPLAQGPLMRIPARGGDPVLVVAPDTTRRERGLRFPQFLPDGRHFLVSVVPGQAGKNTILAGALDSQKADSLLSAFGGVTFVAPNHLLYYLGSGLIARTFDPGTRRVSGDPVTLPDFTAPTNYAGAPTLCATRQGSIAYLSGELLDMHLVWLDPQGHPGATVPYPPGHYYQARLAPDGRRAAVMWVDENFANRIDVVDLERGVSTRLNVEPGDNSNPQWSPDGRRLAYESAFSGGPQHLTIVSLAGDAPVEKAFENDPHFKTLSSWSPDGRYIVVSLLDPVTQHDLWLVPLEGDRAPRRWLAGPGDEANGHISPDGRWMAYVSDESGRNEVYLRSFPNPGQPYQVTTAGGVNCDWLPDGRLAWLAAADAHQFVSASLLPGDEPRVGPGQPIYRYPDDAADFDASRDLKHFLAVMPQQKLPPSTITVVLNWRAPAPRR